MHRTRLCVAVLTLLAAWLFGGVGAGSAGSATLTGTIEEFSGGQVEHIRLAIVYTATGAEDNEILLTETVDESGLLDRNETYIFRDRSIASASGYCRKLSSALSTCYETQTPSLDMASIRMSLGDGDDSMRLRRGPFSVRPLEFRVLAGPGDDYISLEDHTSWDTQDGPGRDYIDCGDGFDRAIVTSSVSTANCESVSLSPTL